MKVRRDKENMKKTIFTGFILGFILSFSTQAIGGSFGNPANLSGSSMPNKQRKAKSKKPPQKKGRKQQHSKKEDRSRKKDLELCKLFSHNS